jgi:2-amino-4-hydroxy-6-hydroxymethyldihydropteridine diphosphokinase
MGKQKVFLLTGSNLGSPAENLFECLQKIESQIGKIVTKSSVYETSAWGKTNQANFLNQALEVATAFTPEQLLNEIHSIEKSIGRIRNEKWEARVIDIDIIYFGNSIINTKNLIVPHPLVAQRKFALVPLVEISGDFVHPIFNKTNAELLKECTDPLDVNLIAS